MRVTGFWWCESELGTGWFFDGGPRGTIGPFRSLASAELERKFWSFFDDDVLIGWDMVDALPLARKMPSCSQSPPAEHPVPSPTQRSERVPEGSTSGPRRGEHCEAGPPARLEQRGGLSTPRNRL